MRETAATASLERLGLDPHIHNLRGELVWPTMATRFLIDQGYLPSNFGHDCNGACPSPCPNRWDPQRPVGGLRSRDTRLAWTRDLRALQEANPDKRLTEFTEDDLVRFLNQPHSRTGARLAPNSVKRRRNSLRSFFTWCAMNRLIAEDPSQWLGKRVRVETTGTKLHNWLTPAECRALLAACQDDLVGRRDRIMLVIALNTGLRLAEICRVTWSQVNFTAMTLDVIGKGGRVATVPLNDGILGALRTWKDEYTEGLGGSPLGLPVLIRFQTRLVQNDADGRRYEVVPMWGAGIGPRAVDHIVRQLGPKIGRPSLAPHDLRRSFCSNVYDESGDIRETQVRMRHSSIATTSIYLQGAPMRRTNLEAGIA